MGDAFRDDGSMTRNSTKQKQTNQPTKIKQHFLKIEYTFKDRIRRYQAEISKPYYRTSFSRISSKRVDLLFFLLSKLANVSQLCSEDMEVREKHKKT